MSLHLKNPIIHLVRGFMTQSRPEVQLFARQSMLRKEMAPSAAARLGKKTQEGFKNQNLDMKNPDWLIGFGSLSFMSCVELIPTVKKIG